jgi:hypothetical protein
MSGAASTIVTLQVSSDAFGGAHGFAQASLDVIDVGELIPIDDQPWNRFRMNARDLHQYLEIGRDCSTWIKDRIGKFQLFAGEDYEVFAEMRKNPKACDSDPCAFWFAKPTNIGHLKASNHDGNCSLRVHRKASPENT